MKLLLHTFYLVIFITTITKSLAKTVITSSEQQQDEDTPEEIIKPQYVYIKSYKELTARLSASRRFLTLVMIGNMGCEKCPLALKIFEKYSAGMNGYTNNFFVDCTELWKRESERAHFPACDPAKEETWPLVQFFKPPLDDYDPFSPAEQSSNNRKPELYPFHGTLSDQHLRQFAQKFMPIFALEVKTKEDMHRMMQSKLIGSKAVMFLNGTQDIPPFFIALTSHYKGKIMFAYTRNEELQKEFAIAETPQLLTFKYLRSQDKYKEQLYRGPRRILAAKSFFQRLAEPSEKKEVNSVYKPSESRKNLTASFALHNFTEFPKQLSSDKCILLLISPLELNASRQNMTLEKIQGIPKYASFIDNFQDYVDAILQYTISESDEAFSSFAKTNSLPVNEEHLLLFPTGGRGVNKFVRVSGKEDKKEMRNLLLNSFDSASTLDQLDEEGLKHFIDNALFRKEQLLASALFLGNKTAEEEQEALLNFQFLAAQSRFKNCLNFGVFSDTNENYTKAWEFPTLPHLVTFISKNKDLTLQTAIHNFTEKGSSYMKMSDYLSQLCFTREKKIVQSNLVEEAVTPEIFEKHCGNGQQCFIALLDFERKGVRSLDQKHFEILSENFRAQTEFHWVIVDGRCHQPLLKSMKIPLENLPTIVYYNSDKLRYREMPKQIGDMQLSEMKAFVESITQKKPKISLKKLSSSLDIDEKKCVKPAAASHQIKTDL